MTDPAPPPAGASADPERMRLRQLLSGHSFVQGLDPADVDVLLDLGEPTSFEAEEVLFRTGNDADRFHLVRSGVVALAVDTGGPMPREIETIAEGTALGWSWMFAPYRWQFDAVARTPVRTIGFDAAGLRIACVEHPEFGFRLVSRMAELIAQRLHATRRQVLNLSR